MLTDAVSGEQTTQNTSVRLATFSNLVPFRTYRCKVAALTVALGPFSTERQVTTHIDGKYIGLVHNVNKNGQCLSKFWSP